MTYEERKEIADKKHNERLLYIKKERVEYIHVEENSKGEFDVFIGTNCSEPPHRVTRKTKEECAKLIEKIGTDLIRIN